MSRQCIQKFEKLFQTYLDKVAGDRDKTVLEDILADGFCGFGTGKDERFYNKEEALELFFRDIDSAPNPMEYTLHKKKVKVFDDHNAAVVAELDLATEIMDQKIVFKNLRLLLLLHEKKGRVQIGAKHISFPADVHEADEAYPLKELEQRARVLQKMVAEKTKTIEDAYREMEMLINQDTLTGLASRYYLERSMKLEQDRHSRFKRKYSLVMIDIDDFKNINDQFGHVTGDRVLKELGRKIRAGTRQTDTVARWGGDEFIILIPESEIQQAFLVGQKIEEAIAVHSWPEDCIVSVSIGISSIRTGENFSTLFERTDKALYQAKKKGKKQIAVLK